MQWVTDLKQEKVHAVAGLARKGIAAAPHRPEGWLGLGRALIALGEFQQATTELREAIAIFPQSAELHLLLAQALAAADLFEDALPCAEAALALAPDDASARSVHADLLAALKRRPGAITDMADAADWSPRVTKMRAASLAPVDTLKLCDMQLAANPGNANAKYLKAIALATLGRGDEARNVIALDRQVEISELPVPPLYRDAQEFRDALTREILANPSLARDPRGKATQGGLQTRCLRQPGAVAVEALLAQFKLAVDGYAARLAALEGDCGGGRPSLASLNAWAVVYDGAGRQKPHIHAGAWISGVFYVSAPRLRGENAYRGPLVFGALNSEKHRFVPPWGTREIEPVPGRLLLFPSHLPHGTEPAGIDGARISVAFDVVPVDGKSPGDTEKRT